MDLFCNLLVNHDLVALNSWSKLGPSFKHAQFTSQLDFILTRTPQADGTAKDVKYLWDASFQPPQAVGHAPMLTTLFYPMHTVMTNHRTLAPWQNAIVFVSHGTLKIKTGNFLPYKATTTLPLHSLTSPLTIASPIYITRSCRSSNNILCWIPVAPVENAVVRQKWHARKLLQYCQGFTTAAIFQAWRHRARFDALDRQCKKFAWKLKQDKLQRLSDEVTQAARKHDMYTMYQVINKYTPKQRQCRIQLRNGEGKLATPVEECALLASFIQTEWTGPALVPITVHLSGLPFDVSAISTIPSTFTPSLVLKTNEEILAQQL